MSAIMARPAAARRQRLHPAGRRISSGSGARHFERDQVQHAPRHGRRRHRDVRRRSAATSSRFSRPTSAVRLPSSAAHCRFGRRRRRSRTGGAATSAGPCRGLDRLPQRRRDRHADSPRSACNRRRRRRQPARPAATALLRHAAAAAAAASAPRLAGVVRLVVKPRDAPFDQSRTRRSRPPAGRPPRSARRRASMALTCESSRSQIRPSAPISRHRQEISRITRAPLRTGARCSLQRRGRRAPLSAAALGLVERAPDRDQRFREPVAGSAAGCFWAARSVRSAPPHRAPCGCRHCGCAWRIRRETSGRARSP